MSMFGGNLLSQQIWLSIPRAKRDLLVKIFSIKKSGQTEVHVHGDGVGTAHTINSDGFTARDLSVISIEKLQEILHKKSDNFYKMLEDVVDHAEEIISGDYPKKKIISNQKENGQSTAILSEEKIKS